MHVALQEIPLATPAVEQPSSVSSVAPPTVKRTLTFDRPYGPLVVDVWEARRPSGVPPVLLLHGWGGSSFYWEGVARALSATATVIVPDFPGAGRSMPVRQTLDLYDQVDVVRQLLDDLGVDKVQVVGHSMGGAIAMLLGAAQPQRITRLIMVSVCLFANRTQQAVYRSVKRVSYLMMSLRHPVMADLPLFPKFAAQRYFFRVPNDPNLLRQGMLDYVLMDRDTAIACANAACDDEIPQAASQLQCPTLLVVCRQDEVTPSQNVDYTARTIPDCTVRWIEECGHLPMLEKADEFLGIARGFLMLEPPTADTPEPAASSAPQR